MRRERSGETAGSQLLDETTDPFAHHPELRGKIKYPETSYFRAFTVERAFADKPHLQWVLEFVYSDEERERSRAQTLADHRGDLWVFAYGSLMWDPAFRFADVRRAAATGFARKFILKDIYGGRGTREDPGLMAALDPGECCDGLAFRIAAADVEAETEILWRREVIGPGYTPAFVEVSMDHGPAPALTFLADHACATICSDITREEQIRLFRRGAGFLGTSRDYLAQIVQQCAVLGIRDEACAALLTAVDAEP